MPLPITEKERVEGAKQFLRDHARHVALDLLQRSALLPMFWGFWQHDWTLVSVAFFANRSVWLYHMLYPCDH